MAKRRAALFTVIFVFLCAFPFIAASQENKNVSTVTGEAFADILKKDGIQIIDVRSAGEYERGHIPGAVNMNVSDSGFSDRIKSLDKIKPLAVYCGSGGRSRKAVKIFSENGFSEIYELKGGLPNWNGQIKK